MRTSARWVAAIGICMLAALPVQAQQQRGGRGGFGGGMGMSGPMLLGMQPIQEELKLSEEQMEKVQAAMAEVREGFASAREDLQDLTPEERMTRLRERMEKASASVRESLKETLTADQWKRLDQIETQLSGPEAFAREAVQKALDLTADQKEKLSSLLASHTEKVREMMEQARADGNFQEVMAQRRELQTKAEETIKGMLTEEQKGAWKELIGSPFQFTPGGRGPGASN